MGGKRVGGSWKDLERPRRRRRREDDRDGDGEAEEGGRLWRRRRREDTPPPSPPRDSERDERGERRSLGDNDDLGHFLQDVSFFKGGREIGNAVPTGVG